MPEIGTLVDYDAKYLELERLKAERGVRPLTRREMEIYLWLVHEMMTVVQVLDAQLRAMMIIEAHGQSDLP